jgi:hypothetical protein
MGFEFEHACTSIRLDDIRKFDRRAKYNVKPKLLGRFMSIRCIPSCPGNKNSHTHYNSNPDAGRLHMPEIVVSLQRQMRYLATVSDSAVPC